MWVQTVLQLGFQGRGVADRALFVRTYKNEGTMCHVICLVSTLGKIFSRKHTEIYFLFFPDHKIWHFMQIVSNIGDNLHKMSNAIFWEKWEKYHQFVICWISPESGINPSLAVRDNSRAGGVCQLKSLSYLQYTTCNHSEQVFSYRSEPTFIQTRHFSLDSQVLDFTHTKKDREYQISRCH